MDKGGENPNDPTSRTNDESARGIRHSDVIRTFRFSPSGFVIRGSPTRSSLFSAIAVFIRLQ